MLTRIKQNLEKRKRRQEQERARREQEREHLQRREAELDARFDEILQISVEQARIKVSDLLDNKDLFDVKSAAGQPIPLEAQLPPSIREVFSQYSEISDPRDDFHIGTKWVRPVRGKRPFIQIGFNYAAPLAVLSGDERIYVIAGRDRPVDINGSYQTVYHYILLMAAVRDDYEVEDPTLPENR